MEYSSEEFRSVGLSIKMNIRWLKFIKTLVIVYL